MTSTDAAVLVERIMYSPYGVPFGIPVGDIVTTGGSEPASGTVSAADENAMSGYLGSSYNIADFDNDGDVDSADETIQTNNLGASLAWGALSDTHNRLGYAGYVFDENLAGTKWHVRHRVLESVLGRWISRDPLGYVDGENLYVYVQSNSLSYIDPTGQAAGSGFWRAFKVARARERAYLDCLNNCDAEWPIDPECWGDQPLECQEQFDCCLQEAHRGDCMGKCWCRYKAPRTSDDGHQTQEECWEYQEQRLNDEVSICTNNFNNCGEFVACAR